VKKAPAPDAGPLAPPPAGPSVPEWARRLAQLLDGAVTIPGTDLRVGLDPILGALLPELGDALTAVLSLTLLVVAHRERVPRVVLWRMLINIALDAILGAIPLLGDVFDFAFKANEKNLALIERHRGDKSRPATLGDKLVVVGVALLALGVLLLPIVALVALIRVFVSATR